MSQSTLPRAVCKLSITPCDWYVDCNDWTVAEAASRQHLICCACFKTNPCDHRRHVIMHTWLHNVFLTPVTKTFPLNSIPDECSFSKSISLAVALLPPPLNHGGAFVSCHAACRPYKSASSSSSQSSTLSCHAACRLTSSASFPSSGGSSPQKSTWPATLGMRPPGAASSWPWASQTSFRRPHIAWC